MLKRYFIPGSEWIYFKIYTGHKTADDILMNVIHPLIDCLYSEKKIDNFFFIRYADPDFHLRLRLHVSQIQDYGFVFGEFYRRMQPCVDNRLVANVMCGTYKRETERYGADSIESLESLFCVDSLAAIRIMSRLSLLPADMRETFRWQMALVLLDNTFDAFGYDLTDKSRLAGKMAEGFKKEFGFTSHAFSKQLNDKYRESRGGIEQIFTSPVMQEKAGEILLARQVEMRQLAEQIEQIRDMGKDVPEMDDLLSSIHHMTMNRWFRSRNRQHEMVIYDFLSRHYNSLLARKQPTV